MPDDEEKKECPLKVGKTSFTDCTEDKCGWWNDGLNECAVKSMGYQLYNIAFSVENARR